jgi:hypothetical protein
MYALVGIACDAESMVPDYTKTPVQVLVDVLRHRGFALLKEDNHSIIAEENIFYDHRNHQALANRLERSRFLAQHNYVTHFRLMLGVSKIDVAVHISNHATDLRQYVPVILTDGHRIFQRSLSQLELIIGAS